VKFDLMVGANRWADIARLASDAEGAGLSGMVFTETSQTPWMSIAAAAMAAPTLTFSTGIAVAFPRSPMVTAQLAWELADNTAGRFRLGLGSQVKAHVERRYGVAYDPAAPRLRDYMRTVRACWAAFGGARLDHHGPFYDLSLLPAQWTPRRHPHGDIKLDISAVGPVMCRLAGELADGIHVHPLHSVDYLHNRLLPAVAEGAGSAGRDPASVELIVPVFAVPEEEAGSMLDQTRQQIAFYGSTRNYAFQFDDLGFEGTSARLNERLKAGDLEGLTSVITDDMLERFAVVAPWDQLADRLVERYSGLAGRVVMYQAEESIRAEPSNLGRWGEVARSVTGR
jgi:probable F420-dependent oxidoreductase